MHFDAARSRRSSSLMLFFVMAVIDGPLGEEIGWRGVLLPRADAPHVAARRRAAIVGVVWYAWHVPLYATDEKLPGSASTLIFLYSCVALSVIMTWFFLKSERQHIPDDLPARRDELLDVPPLQAVSEDRGLGRADWRCTSFCFRDRGAASRCVRVARRTRERESAEHAALPQRPMRAVRRRRSSVVRRRHAGAAG